MPSIIFLRNELEEETGVHVVLRLMRRKIMSQRLKSMWLCHKTRFIGRTGQGRLQFCLRLPLFIFIHAPGN